MLKPRKKLSKREIKEDPVLETINKVTLFLENNWQKLSGGFFLVVLIVFVYTFMEKSSLEHEHEGATALFVFEDQYMNANYNDQLIAGLNSVIADYGDTDAGSKAAFFLANTYFNKGDYEIAETNFTKFLNNYSGTDFMKCSAISGIAASYEQRGLYQKAVDNYLKAYNSYSKLFLAAENLIGSARGYAKLGNLEKVKEQCDKILRDFPNTPQAQDAEVLLARL